ncbi:MAG: enoyl-CoA hydratase/isomerase family protein [Pseudomonadota bacterium]|nr:enoyl-CoA hydratase/isomerase family protein [Pseudomonadota bacterium]
MSPVSVEYSSPEGNRTVAVLRLDDGKANAFNPATLDALARSLDEIDQSDAHALVIAGRTGFFSGGLDLKALPHLPTAEKREVLTRFGEVLLRVFMFRAPTVAAVTGHAIAGGALLALATDVRFGADLPARFGVTEIAIGLPVPSFGVLLAKAALAPPALVEIMLHARVLTLREAHARGAFLGLYPEAAVVDAAAAYAAELARLHGPAYAATKHLLWDAELERIRGGLADEVVRFIDLFEARFPMDPRGDAARG